MRYVSHLLICLSLALFITINSCLAIRCLSCQDCLNTIPSENSYKENITCSPLSNACLKLTFKNYVLKGCAKSTNCNADGLMNSMENTWIRIKSAVGGDDAKMILSNQINVDGSIPVACCTDDFCNKGRWLKISPQILGVASVIFLILK